MLVHCADCIRALQDNVLLEWTLMLELLAVGRLRAVFPVFIGELLFDSSTGGTAASSWQGPLMGSLFESRAYLCLSTAIHARVNEQARLTLEEMQIRPSARLASRTIKGVVEEISKHLGIKAHELFVSTGTRPGHVLKGGRQHEWEAGLRRLVQTVRKTLVGMLERQLDLDATPQLSGDEPSGVRLASDAPPAMSVRVDPVAAEADGSAVREATAEMERLQVAVEVERLRAAAEAERLQAAAEMSKLRAAAAEMEQVRSVAEAERLRAAAEAEMSKLRAAAEMDRLRSVAEAERLRAAVEVEQLRAQVAEAEAAVAGTRLRAAEAAQSQQSGCCGVS